MPHHSSGDIIAFRRVQPQQAGRLTLTSEAIGEDGQLGDAYSAYDHDISPPLMWTGMPDADTYALILEDPDAPAERPTLHWAVWNIPGALEGLPANLRKTPILEDLGGLTQGRNYRGAFGYAGPRPPPGDGPHRYHFQLFALDRHLDLPPTAPLEALVQVLEAHAIAACELVGIYEEGGALEPRSFTDSGLTTERGGLDSDDVDRHAPHDAQGAVRPDHRH